MKSASLLALLLLSPVALACDDTSHLGLSGSLSVETCHGEGADCIYSHQAMLQYMDAIPDNDRRLGISLHSSPWRLYDGEMRILTIEEVAAQSRPTLAGSRIDHVELVGSWTGVSPAPGVPSLAEQLSKELDGFPVQGEDGFLWVSPDGKRRTTRQAFTARQGAGSYFVPKGADVLVSLVAGWPAFVEGNFGEDEHELQMRAAAGWDIFMLCPEKALAGFEHAAKNGNAVAAYNAALMRLQRNGEGDFAKALALLERGTALGDEKSKRRLARERVRILAPSSS